MINACLGIQVCPPTTHSWKNEALKEIKSFKPSNTTNAKRHVWQMLVKIYAVWLSIKETWQLIWDEENSYICETLSWN